MYQEESTSEKFVFFSLYRHSDEVLMGDRRDKPKRKYEDTLSSHLWRVYGKLIWRPFQRFLGNVTCSKPYGKSFFKAMMPEKIEHPEFQSYSFIFLNTAYRVSNPMYIMLSYPVGWIKDYFWSNSHLVCNRNYSVKEMWRTPIKGKLLQRPFIHFAKFIEYTFRKDFTCCGYNGSLCEYDDSDRFELIASGATSTPDGTDYWFRGYVHCPRCNTPIWHSDGSL